MAGVAQPVSTQAMRPGEAPRPKVVYVLGAGRSGSTILGVALGNCDGVFFAGELDKWLTESGRPTLDDPERARFWGGVREQVKNAEHLFGYQTRCLERSSAVFQIRAWPARRRLRSEYRRVSEELYLAIARATGATHIVDSSHYPLRARELQGLAGIDLYLLYLVRDPHSVVASLGRKDVPERSFGTLVSNAYLFLTHLFAVPVFLRHPRARRLFLRYEDLRANPERVLGEVLRQLDSNASVPDVGSLRTGVPLHGNRLVAEEVVALEDPARSGRRGSPLTTILQLPWTLVFALLRPKVNSSTSRAQPRADALAQPRARLDDR